MYFLSSCRMLGPLYCIWHPAIKRNGNCRSHKNNIRPCVGSDNGRNVGPCVVSTNDNIGPYFRSTRRIMRSPLCRRILEEEFRPDFGLCEMFSGAMFGRGRRFKIHGVVGGGSLQRGARARRVRCVRRISVMWFSLRHSTRHHVDFNAQGIMSML